MYPNSKLQEVEKNNDKIDDKLLYLTLFYYYANICSMIIYLLYDNFIVLDFINKLKMSEIDWSRIVK